MKRLLASLLLMASPLIAQPTYDMTADVNYPDRKLQPLTFLQGATPEMRVYIEQAGSTYTNIASDSLVFYYGTSGNASSFVQVTNSSVTAASGYFTVNFTAANLNTNGSFWYTVILKDGSGGMYYSGDGDLEIKKTTVTGSPGNLDLTSILDWSLSEYLNAGNGPTIGDGTTISAVTNASGQLVLTSMASGVAWGAITGTLSDQTDLNSELTNRYTKAEVDGLIGTETLAEVLANGSTSGANDILMSAWGLDKSRGLGLIVNDGISSTTNYLDSILDGEVRYAGDILAKRDWVTGLGYGIGDFLADGSVPMTGDLNMGTGAITNVGNVDGVDVSAIPATYVSKTGTSEADGTFSLRINDNWRLESDGIKWYTGTTLWDVPNHQFYSITGVKLIADFDESLLISSNGIWRSEGEATSGNEIVNYQTMTGMNYVATGDSPTFVTNHITVLEFPNGSQITELGSTNFLFSSGTNSAYIGW